MNNNPKVTLSQDQVAELFNYTRRMHIQYKDVQFEIVDHIATGVEKTMSSDNNLTFNRALYEYTGTLPIRFFNDLIEEKTKSLTRYWNRRFFSYLSGFITVPKIIISIVLYIFFYCCINFIGSNNFIYFYFFYLILLLCLSWYKRTLILDHTHLDYLVIKTFQRGLFYFSIIVFIIPIHYIGMKDEYILQKPWGEEFISLVFTAICLFFYSIKYVFAQMLKTELNEKYGHLNLKLL